VLLELEALTAQNIEKTIHFTVVTQVQHNHSFMLLCAARTG
jgi:hypothetical protein